MDDANPLNTRNRKLAIYKERFVLKKQKKKKKKIKIQDYYFIQQKLFFFSIIIRLHKSKIKQKYI